jgi:hypothetical protein
MQLSPVSEDAIISKMVIHGATQFSRLLYLSNKILDLVRSNRITFIMAPTDAALQAFATRYSKPLQDLADTKLGQTIVENHFSSTFDGLQASARMLSGQILPLDAKVVPNYGIVGGGKIGNVIIYFISIVIIYPDQDKLWRTERSAGFKSNLGTDGFKALILQGSIKGQDLINLCSTNFEAKEFCDKKDAASGRTIFHTLLEREFGIDLPGSENAKNEYLRHYRGSYTYYTHVRGNVLIPRLGVEPLRATLVSDEKHLEVLRVGMILICLTIENKIKAYTFDATLGVNGAGFTEIPVALGHHLIPPPLPVDDVFDLPKIKKLTSYSYNGVVMLYALGYNGHIYIAQITARPMLEFHDQTFTYPLIDISGRVGLYRPTNSMVKSIQLNHPSMKDSGQIAEVPQNAVGIFNQGNSLILQNTGYCAVNDLKYGVVYVLNDFPGGKFQCDVNHIFYNSSLHQIFILNDLGELWSNKYDRATSRGEGWIKLRIPEGIQIIDVYPNAGISLGSYVPDFLNSRGEIMLIDYTFTNGTMTVIATIPGLAKLFGFMLENGPVSPVRFGQNVVISMKERIM